MPTLPDFRVGEPIQYEALGIFPLFTEPTGCVDYLLSDEAIAAGTVTVTEIGEEGSVPNLIVKNTGDARVLFIEGEELRGAKQNRVLNTSVLVAAHSETKIPVSTGRDSSRDAARATRWIVSSSDSRSTVNVCTVSSSCKRGKSSGLYVCSV